MPLTSSPKSAVTKIAAAPVDGGKPMEDGSLIAEGPHLVEEAMASAWRVEHIFCSRAGLERWQALAGEAARRGIELTEVSDRAFKTVSGTEQSQGILALVQPRTFSWPRSADACRVRWLSWTGFKIPAMRARLSAPRRHSVGVAWCWPKGSVRVSNGKFLRAAAGSLFRLPFLENQARADIIERVSCAGRTMFVLVAGEGASLLHHIFHQTVRLGSGQ